MSPIEENRTNRIRFGACIAAMVGEIGEIGEPDFTGFTDFPDFTGFPGFPDFTGFPDFPDFPGFTNFTDFPHLCRMRWKSALLMPFARRIAHQLEVDAKIAVELQRKTMVSIVQRARGTGIGQELGFDKISSHKDFTNQVPIRNYEALRPYIEEIMNGKRDVLWPGTPRYFAKSSGTTSGIKYIPITTESIPNHIHSARNALFNYCVQKGSGRIFDGKMIFLSGSPALEDKGGIPTGRLSGIVNHLVPTWVRGNQLPSYQTNCIEEWERKVDAITGETDTVDMRLISGIPPWVQMYYERLIERTGKPTIKDIFPNYTLFVYGGVNYAPYAAKLEYLVGKHIDTLETYPASEGFIAYQDTWPSEGMRLNINSGIFFEFVPADQIHTEHPDRLLLNDVETDKDYAVIINSNAGLWGYSIGDTIRFVSKNPYRIIFSGRVEHFISAFGEHVIAREVEQAMTTACTVTGVRVIEFTVAPQVDPPDGGLPYHEWFIEFDTQPSDRTLFRDLLESSMLEQNIYYKDLIDGHILRPLVVTQVPKEGFRRYMDAQGKLGGQNKLPRLKNDREIADKLLLN